MSHPKVLLTPGPCMTTESVRQAGAGPDLNHRDPEFLDLIRETKNGLLKVYGQTQSGWKAYLLGGSGTLAVEAMITSCVKQGPVLVLENGYYSSRIRDIFAIHGIPFVPVTHGWLEAWDFDRIERELGKGYEAVIGVHNETTTGRLNDVGRLGELCRRHGAHCLVDAMSSFAADDIDFSCLDAVCASANKCLHGVPGVAFALIRESLGALLDEVPRRSYYMSLPLYEGDIPPLTPPVPALASLRQAIREFAIAGIEGRQGEYAHRAAFIREQLKNRGFRAPIPDSEMSCTLSTFTLPRHFDFDRWFQANLEAGFVIYACKGDLREKYFQVANMGELSHENLVDWIEAVDQILA